MSECWNITAKKKLIENGMNLKELAKAVDVNYTVVCAVLKGKVIRETVKERICKYLNVEEDKR